MNPQLPVAIRRAQVAAVSTLLILLTLAWGASAAQNRASVLNAAFAPKLTIDGDRTDWNQLSSSTVSMDTQGRGTNGTMAVDIRYAWDYEHLYILVAENPAKITAATNSIPNLYAQEGPDGTAYADHPWLLDSIGFWIDLDNNAGTLVNDVPVVEGNADFQPWFGFSSVGRNDLVYARVNNSDTLNLAGLANAVIATGGSFAQRNRTIEIAIKWADVAAVASPSRQPGEDLVAAIRPGYTFGSEPLLIANDYNAQAFIGPDQWNPGSGVDQYSRDVRLISSAPLVNAAFAPKLAIDGDRVDWTALPSSTVSMDTQGRGTNGTLAVDIQYAWDYENLYILVAENPTKITSSTNNFPNLYAQEGPDGAAYADHPWLLDSIGFWIDLDNTAGTVVNGAAVVEGNADFQPWFGFSSAGQTDLVYGRVNNSDALSLAALANAVIATGGSFAKRNRTIEIAIKWSDVASTVSPSRQPNEDLVAAIRPGYIFGSEPLLIANDYNAQAFIGPDQWNPGSGMDAYSRDIQLVSGAPVIEAGYAPDLKIDGDLRDWAGLPSGTISMDTQGRGTNGTLAVDIRYAWDYESLYILVAENASKITATTNSTPNLYAQEGPDGTAYADHPWLLDSIGFWIDLDNNAGTVVNGAAVVEGNADFQPWFGFSSAGRTDLVYGRINNSDKLNLDALANAVVATGGSFAQRNRIIEIAIKWADLAAAASPSRQPGEDLVSAIQPGYTFGSEPLLIANDYNAQAFIGPDQWNPGNGMDVYSRDIRLSLGTVPTHGAPQLKLRTDGLTVLFDWLDPDASYRLETSATLGTTAVWSPATGVLTRANGAAQQRLARPTVNAFYRLTR